MLLARKLVRELRASRGQSLAVLVVTLLGVLLFVTSAGAYLDLRDSYAETQSRLALADLHVSVEAADSADVARLSALPGVRAVEARQMAEVPVHIGDERIDLRMLSLPERLDRVLVTSGRLPARPDEILVEKHLAQHHHLEIGSVIRLARGTDDRPLRVSGIGVSAEYLWVARDAHDVMPSPDAFGVAWMQKDAIEPGETQLLVAGRGVEREVRQALGARMTNLVAAPALPGIRLLQMDVDGYKGMAAFFPILFLGVGAFIVAALLARMVDAQRPIIGTLMALGMGRARILLHYLGYALVLGGGGALLGALAGMAAGPSLTREYAVELGIPYVTATWRIQLAAIGFVLGAGAALVAGLIPALHASRLHPAEAMRPPRPSTGPLARATRRLHTPLPIRMALRDLLGRPLRSLGTMAGVAAALLLVLTTGALLDSMRATIRALFQDARRYDLRIDFVAPEPLAEVRARLSALSGVERVEGVIALPASISAGDRVESDVLVQGLRPDPRLLRSVDVDGRAAPPGDGIALTRAVASALHVGIGDHVTLRLPTGPPASFRVAAFADAALGKTASVRRDDLARAFGLGDRVTSAVIAVRPDAIAAARRAIVSQNDVAHVEDLVELRDQVREMMGLGWVMLLVMLLFSVILAAAILFNTATLGILERRRELATLRALGRTLREIGLSLTLEHALLCVAGLAAGFPLSVLAIRRLLALYSNDLFRLPFVLSTPTVALAAAGIIVVLLLAQWPALRQVGRESLAEAVRSREG